MHKQLKYRKYILNCYQLIYRFHDRINNDYTNIKNIKLNNILMSKLNLFIIFFLFIISFKN